IMIAAFTTSMAGCGTNSPRGNTDASGGNDAGGISRASALSHSATADLEETIWTLTELNGNPVTARGPGGKQIHIVFRRSGNRVEGFAGCNGFGGKYELKEGSRIAISNVIGTMMACDLMEIENQLHRALISADNYSLAGNKLRL